MLGYKRIVIATDLSPHGKKTLTNALALAQTTVAEVHVIHVIESSPFAYAGEFSIPMDTNIEQTIETQARQALGKVIEEHGIKEDNICLTTGSVRAAVIDYAKKIKADLIMVGAHGHGAVDAFLGSRANAILHHAKCDVWVFKG